MNRHVGPSSAGDPIAHRPSIAPEPAAHNRRMVVPHNQQPQGQPATAEDALEIRPPRLDDAAGAAAIHLGSWLATYTPLVGADAAARFTLAERLAHWEWLLGSQPANRGALLAIRSGAVIGLVEWELGVDADAGTGEIHALHVAPGERGRGVGWRLLDASVAALRSRGLRRAILWVVETNSAARAFYERQGWAWDGTRVDRPLGGFPDFPAVVEVLYVLDLG
jgi:ribosomal protein S18 acetylase RimI-like enzyme